MKTCIVILIATAFGCLAHAATLATINGVAINDDDFHIPKEIREAGSDRVSAYLSYRIDKAVDQELLYQGARKEGLHEDQAYLATLEAEKAQQEFTAAIQLVNHYENNIPKFKTAGDPNAVSDEAIDAEFNKNPDLYKRRTAEQAKMIIRARLADEKRRELYPSWLKSVLAVTTVEADGRAVPADALEDAVDRNLQGGVHEGIGPLWQAILDAKELTLPADLDDVAAADTIAFTKAIGEVTVKVGKSSILLSETSPMQAIATNGAALRLDAWLFFVVKSYAVRDYAQAAGYDRDPQFFETAAASRAARLATPFSHYDGLEQSVLVKYYLYHGVEVTDEEIDAHFHENAEVLAELEERTSPEKVRRQIEQTLTFQKVRERRSELLTGLRLLATIDKP